MIDACRSAAAVVELPDLFVCLLLDSGGGLAEDTVEGMAGEEMPRMKQFRSVFFDQKSQIQGRKAGRQKPASRLDLLLENMAKNAMSAVTFPSALVRVSEKAKGRRDGWPTTEA
jgi:hypothetical protein